MRAVGGVDRTPAIWVWNWSFGWWVRAASVALLATACGGGFVLPGKPEIEVPAYAKFYSTSAGSNGVRGGGAAGQAEALLKEKLAARGDQAEPDGALAATAAWAMRRAYSDEGVTDTRVLADAAHRFGFTGMVEGFVVMPFSEARARELVRSMLSGVPSNSRVNRYGIMAGQGSDVALLIGVVEATLEDFPRSVAPGSTLRLEGQVSSRFDRASVFATDPNGATRELPMRSRTLDARLEFPQVGAYSVEVMGYGKSGPVVLMNVPVLVGVKEAEMGAGTDEGAEADPNLTAEAAQAELFTLLNQERTKRGVNRVELDGELAGIALSHSQEMVESDFFGHVSPTTGGPEDRIRRADVRVSKAGECVALEITPLRAHRGLLASPAHRAAMLDPSFSHVGVGVAFGKDEAGPRRLRATLLFGRRVPLEETLQSAESVFEAMQSYRRAHDLSALQLDRSLSEVAAAGTQSLASGSSTTVKQALAASAAELQRSVQRARKSRSVCQSFIEILERDQLSQMGLLKDANLLAVGVSVVELKDTKGSRLGVLVAGEARPGKTLRCQ
jgi:uncharacterized protein YkwD